MHTLYGASPTSRESNTDILEELLSKNEVDGKPADLLLFLACQRELPNMDVVRLLADTGHVDVNARSRTTAERAASREDRGWADRRTMRTSRTQGRTRRCMNWLPAGTGGVWRRVFRICCPRALIVRCSTRLGRCL